MVVQVVHREDPFQGQQDQATQPEIWVWGALRGLSIPWEDADEPGRGEMKATVPTRGAGFDLPLNDVVSPIS